MAALLLLMLSTELRVACGVGQSQATGVADGGVFIGAVASMRSTVVISLVFRRFGRVQGAPENPLRPLQVKMFKSGNKSL